MQWFILNIEPPSVPTYPKLQICRPLWSSSSEIVRGLGACLRSFPCSLLQSSQKKGYTVYRAEIFSEQLGGIHFKHSVREGTRAQRVQTRHTPLSASVTWHDILIRRGQSWEFVSGPRSELSQITSIVKSWTGCCFSVPYLIFILEIFPIRIITNIHPITLRSFP